MAADRDEQTIGAFVECLMLHDTEAGEENVRRRLRVMTRDELFDLCVAAIGHNYGLLAGMAACEEISLEELIPDVARDLWADYYGLAAPG